MQSICEQCKCEFTPKPGNKGRFCSAMCFKKWQVSNGRQIKTCPTCQKEFSTYKDPANARTYCSKDCRPAKVKKIKKMCKGCDKEFFVFPSMNAQEYCTLACRQNHKCTITSCPNCGNDVKSWKNNIHTYCSRECEKSHSYTTSVCPECNTTFEHLKSSPRIYCSRKCSNDNNAKANLGIVELPPMFCEQCGDEITSNKYANKRFCSQKCFGEWQSLNITGEAHPLFKGTRHDYYGPNWRTQRRKARKRDSYKCQCCGKTQKQNGRSLDVHHLIPFRDFGYIAGINNAYIKANALSNLVSLCKSCHKLAEHGKVPIQPYLL